jgi:folate-binding protein YgfZ
MTTDGMESEFKAMLQGAAFATLPDRALLRVSGPDATRWLNGMVTNSVQSLAPGEGNYNFLLNAQGRIQGDATIYREPAASANDAPSYLLTTDAAQAEKLQPLLDRFIIMDDVELCSLELAGIRVIGASAHRLIAEISGPESGIVAPASVSMAGKMYQGLVNGRKRITVFPPSSGYEKSGIERAELWCFDPDDLAMLERWLPQIGCREASLGTLNALRVYCGVPAYGVDIRDRDLPQETNQPHALHFNKGCYLGQEIVERIRSRGQVHRLLTRFELNGALPKEFPAALETRGGDQTKPAGELTSAALVPLPDGPKLLALGYARREALDLHQELHYAGGTAVPLS